MSPVKSEYYPQEHRMKRLSRRKFIEKGFSGLALASIPLVFKANPLEAFGNAPAEALPLSGYYKMFGVDEALIRRIMGVALSKGGDYCDLYFQNRVFHYIGLEDNIVNNAYTGIDFGVGIRVLKGDQTGYSFTEEITTKAMELAAQTAASIATSGKTVSPQELKPHQTPQYYAIQIPWEEVKPDRKVAFLPDLNQKVFSLDKRVIKCRLTWLDEYSHILIANSDGRVVSDYQPMTGMYGSCTAEQNGKKEEGYAMTSGRYGIEYYTPDRIQALAKKAVDRTVLLFEAVKPEAGEMEVVMGPGSSGILLHEAIGHGMEADFNRKKVSTFADKMGKPVAEKLVQIIDDGTIPHLRGSINVDDEGNDSQKTVLVENGVLSSYLHDRISAQHYKVKPTGNGRRETFRDNPIPRMRNTYMPAGPHAPEEILRSVKKGIYTEEFSNGEVNIGAGDFTFYVKTGYLIEDGKKTRPIKDVNVIGNGPEVLRRITMVGNDLKFDDGLWTCGKNGQGMPNQMGIPTVKVSAITVGGVNR
jgi:TldD protein